MPLAERFLTHRVENQVAALCDYDAFATDAALQESVRREGGGWAEPMLADFGPVAGGELMRLGFLANENLPKLRAFDAIGQRIDEVEFHPAYHRLMQLGVEHGVPNFSWRNEQTPGAHVARAALAYLHMQPEQGHNCPLTMTHACVPALRQQPALAREWLPRVLTPHYDGRCLPAHEKPGNTIGMGMTEKQGGSDVRSNATRATPAGSPGPGEAYELVGHKFFFSAPMSDAFLVLAQAAGGISCFLLPRFLPDGTRNAIRLQRLKDKLGDRSNASAEVEFAGAVAWLIGEEGRGVATILEMVAQTRQDCLIGSAGIMRQALVQAIHYSRGRRAFGKRLVDQPLMMNVLADLAIESEAALSLAMRVARAIDAAPRDPQEAAFARVATAIGKYHVCKRCPPVVNEAQECLGGSGYIEDSILPRLYRQAPVNSIWEGSGNIQCLDLLRALRRDPATREALVAELRVVAGENRRLDAEVGWIERSLGDGSVPEAHARLLTERIALALEAVQLLRAGQGRTAELFIATRLDGQHGQCLGTLPTDAPFDALIDRAFPEP
ncbi:MAG TPA: isovaleryl-CoA dehydrogenase [Chiayiivirga sp.]|nr:isovaleryl-CoA dehydrogenase [Chiayiivirga sp.]